MGSGTSKEKSEAKRNNQPIRKAASLAPAVDVAVSARSASSLLQQKHKSVDAHHANELPHPQAAQRHLGQDDLALDDATAHIAALDTCVTSLQFDVVEQRQLLSTMQANQALLLERISELEQLHAQLLNENQQLHAEHTAAKSHIELLTTQLNDMTLLLQQQQAGSAALPPHMQHNHLGETLDLSPDLLPPPAWGGAAGGWRGPPTPGSGQWPGSAPPSPGLSWSSAHTHLSQGDTPPMTPAFSATSSRPPSAMTASEQFSRQSSFASAASRQLLPLPSLGSRQASREFEPGTPHMLAPVRVPSGRGAVGVRELEAAAVIARPASAGYSATNVSLSLGPLPMHPVPHVQV